MLSVLEPTLVEVHQPPSANTGRSQQGKQGCTIAIKLTTVLRDWRRTCTANHSGLLEAANHIRACGPTAIQDPKPSSGSAFNRQKPDLESMMANHSLLITTCPAHKPNTLPLAFKCSKHHTTPVSEHLSCSCHVERNSNSCMTC
eukprot:GHRR01008675.1.p2 GENE.GHRR01008675.1~~GHRR01008675.1.p2  ORF type:complete len:144 (-),score=28.47 GHRR01008675.1:132-563(-)